MIKTSTKTKSSIQSPEGSKKESGFYDSIKPKLNALIKQPSEETIESILEYSKKR